MIRENITLTHFIIEDQRSTKGASGDLSVPLIDIVTSYKTITHQVSRRGFGADAIDLRTYLERTVSDSMIKATTRTGRLTCMRSKSVDGITPILAKYPHGKYLLAFDQLNGSGNLDINFMSGTIFPILCAPVGRRKATAKDFLQAGSGMVARGFVRYCASTRLELTTGQTVGSDSDQDWQIIDGLENGILLSGCNSNNTQIGTMGNDVLTSRAGNCQLTGGRSQGLLRFDTLPNATTNLDNLTDFNVADDTLQLENANFTALTATGPTGDRDVPCGEGHHHRSAVLRCRWQWHWRFLGVVRRADRKPQSYGRGLCGELRGGVP